MVDTIINWTDNNVAETGYDIYKSLNPLIPTDLPTKIGNVGANIITFTDTSPTLNQINYYTVVPTATGISIPPPKEVVSAGRKIIAGNLDYSIDFMSNVTFIKETGLSPVTESFISDIHLQAIFIPDVSGNFVSKAANIMVRNDGIGLQTVPTRTNLIPNNSMTGAVAGSPGTTPTNGWSAAGSNGVARTNIDLSSVLGLPSVDITYAGTANASAGLFTSVTMTGLNGMPVTAGLTYTASLWYAVLSGGWDNDGNNKNITLRIQWFDAAGANLSQTDVSFTATAIATRLISTVVAPVSAVFASFQLRHTITNAIAYNWQERIIAPQFELGEYASPPILTTSGSVVRNQNRPSFDITGKFLTGVSGFVKVNVLNPTNASFFGRILTLSDGTDGNRVAIYHSGGNLTMVVTVGGSVQAQFNLGAWATGLQTIAFSAGPNFVLARRVGSTLLGADTVATYPVFSIAELGNGTTNVNYQLLQKLVLKSGTQSQATFDAMYAIAVAS